MLLHLDYIFYIILILLLGFLINKEMTTEGFDHTGKADVAAQYKTDTTSVIKAARYGGWNKWTTASGFTDTIDVKPILDQLIKKRTSSIVVSDYTFGLKTDISPGNNKYLLIQFVDPTMNAIDAKNPTPTNVPKSEDPRKMWQPWNGAWTWDESASMSLKFGTGANPFWLTMVESFYNIADLFAIIVIKMPYKMLSQIVALGVQFLQNLRNILKPILDFMRQMRKIAKGIFDTIFKQIKKVFKKIMAILKDLPGFIKEMFDNVIDIIQTAVTKTFEMLKKVFDVIKKIFWTIIKLPIQLFDIVNQLVDVIMNLFMILIGLPTAALNMIIGFQEIMIDVMSKTPTIPFMNMFFK